MEKEIKMKKYKITKQTFGDGRELFKLCSWSDNGVSGGYGEPSWRYLNDYGTLEECNAEITRSTLTKEEVIRDDTRVQNYRRSANRQG